MLFYLGQHEIMIIVGVVLFFFGVPILTWFLALRKKRRDEAS